MVHHRLLAGTAGGTLVSTLGQLAVHDVLKTALLAAFGAAVRFGVTLLLQRLTRKPRK